MKRTSLSVILVVSLLGSPAPVQAANGMADMMSIMMEMFLWMMRGASSGGGGFGGINPYSIGGPGIYGNPMLANSLLGNPLLGGYQQGWGNSLPYGTQGMYSPLGYPGLASSYNPYSSNPYSSQYSSPYYPGYYGSNTAQGYGYHPYYQQAYSNPFYPYRYNLNSRDKNSYKEKRYSQPGEYNHRNSYNNYGSAAGHANGQIAPVVIQPIIVSPTPHPSTTQPEANERDQYPDQYPAIVNAPLGVPAAPLNAEPVTVDDHDYSGQSWDKDNPLYGEWQGINGEYMSLGSNQFHLRSGETDLQGTYQVKNSILKAEIPNRAEPVYMQYRLNDGYLMFLSEDGQKMLFRRFP